MDVPENAPEHCPGTGSEAAGKTSACAGCPNQKICASGETAGPDPDIPVIRDKLAPIKHKIVVLSGKGGVGKTSVTAMLARGFARRYPSSNVAVLDVDICGPSMPRVMGVEGEAVHVSGAGWSPVSVDDNVCMMSIGFLLESLDDAVVWRGPKKNGLIKQFLRDVDWGTSTDYLLIDTPPGTSDEHLSVVQYLIPAKPDGAVIVTTPQEVSLLDVRKEINFCRKVGLPIIGVVENMSGFACPKCDKESEIFPALTGGAEKMCQDMGIRFLGKLPLDPRIGQYCDQGTDFFEDCAESPAAIAYQKVLDGIDRSCTQNAESSAGDAV